MSSGLLKSLGREWLRREIFELWSHNGASMINYDDLLAARYLNQIQPQLRPALEKALKLLDDGRFQGSLLFNLVSKSIITHKVGREIHDETIRYNRNKALRFFIQLLKAQGVSSKKIDQAMDGLGENADAVQLGEVLIRLKSIDRESARKLRYQTRLSLDRYRAEQVDTYLQQVGRGQRRTTVLESVSVPKALEDELEAAPEEDEMLLSRTLADVDHSFQVPKFGIPDFVDMGDELTGKTLKGYRFLGKIGAGAMGNVYLCDRKDDERPIALKLLSRDADSEAKDRFKREVFIQGLLPTHKYIVELYDAGMTKTNYHYLAMEFFNSTDLEKLIKLEGQIEPRRAIRIMIQVLEALSVAHKAKIVHRDLKPANILVSNDSDEAKLVDWGIALNLEMGALDQFVFKSMEGSVTGTAEYVSPEQAFGGPINTQSDLYSLGVVLYFCLSGQLPFVCENSRGYLTSHMMDDPIPLQKSYKGKALPKRTFSMMEKLLEKEPEDRFQTAAELKKELELILKELQILRSGQEESSGKFWRALGLGRN